MDEERSGLAERKRQDQEKAEANQARQIRQGVVSASEESKQQDQKQSKQKESSKAKSSSRKKT